MKMSRERHAVFVFQIGVEFHIREINVTCGRKVKFCGRPKTNVSKLKLRYIVRSKIGTSCYGDVSENNCTIRWGLVVIEEFKTIKVYILRMNV